MPCIESIKIIKIYIDIEKKDFLPLQQTILGRKSNKCRNSVINEGR